MRFRKLKDAYGERSKLVHGARSKKLNDQKSKDLSALVEDVIRQALIKVLSDPERVKIFDSKGRDEYLEEMVFLR